GRKRKAADEDGEPAKRTRKPKDPNAPKRPASSYILYQNEIRKELREKHPGVTNSELLNIIARQWAEMSDADKAVYNNAVASAKEQYSQEKKAYDS
ncbi:high mobility group box domain-containing protein, partial [Collybia nuda]